MPERAATLDILLLMRLRGFFLLALTFPGLFGARNLRAQTGLPAPVYLYPNGAPGALGNGEPDKPRMYPFLPKKRSTSAAVLVIPGGGYEHVAITYEGFQIAAWLNAQGKATPVAKTT